MDAGVDPVIPGVESPRTSFADIVEPVAAALEQERRVSDQVEALAKVAREEGDYLSEQFTLWFLKEQVEEVATMSDLLRVVERARENPMFAEDYLAREHPGEEGADPTAPPAAGGAL
jgi:bacterioferritin B